MKQALLLSGVLLIMPFFFCGCGNEAEKTEETGIETVEINKKWKEMVRPAARRSRLERDSVSVVNQIIRENPGKIRGHCTRVELTEKLSVIRSFFSYRLRISNLILRIPGDFTEIPAPAIFAGDLRTIV